MKCCSKNCDQGRICHKLPAKAGFYRFAAVAVFIAVIVYLLSPAANANEFSDSFVGANTAPLPKPKPRPEPVPPESPVICRLLFSCG